MLFYTCEPAAFQKRTKIEYNRKCQINFRDVQNKIKKGLIKGIQKAIKKELLENNNIKL